MTIWFDAEDLIQFFQTATRPTGIQRFSFETYRALWRQAGATGTLRFCRRAKSGFKPIHFPALEAGILAAADAKTPARFSSIPQPPRETRLAIAARRLPLHYRLPLGAMARAGLAATAASRDLWRAVLRPRGAPGNRIGGHQFDLPAPAIAFTPDDWLVNLGASWVCPYPPKLLTSLHSQGARLALLAHDLIPELYPEWCTPGTVRDFSNWLHTMVPQTSLMFTVSRHTAQDLSACLQKHGTTIAPPAILPTGSHGRISQAATAPLLPSPYILMVGTIEVRKNHAGMLRLWRRLLATMPEASVPTLVFAGKTGWLTADLLQQLANANWLGGKIRFIDSPSETTLANLYQHCLFTLFPSFYEGWGLPVTESLCFGKTAVISNRASIPEAGQSFCTYFDPENLTEAAATIRALLENPQQVARLEQHIAARFTPPTWDATADALLNHLGTQKQPGTIPARAPAQ